MRMVALRMYKFGGISRFSTENNYKHAMTYFDFTFSVGRRDMENELWKMYEILGIY